MTTPLGEAKVPVLIVDDQSRNILAFEAALASPEYELIGVHSGQEAVEAVKRQEFAVVLMDVLMPDMDGIAAARALRQVSQDRPTPIVLVTAVDASPAEIHEASERRRLLSLLEQLPAVVNVLRGPRPPPLHGCALTRFTGGRHPLERSCRRARWALHYQSAQQLLKGRTMGLVSQDLFSQRVLAYCDRCDDVLLPRHRRTPRSFRACGPVDIEPLFSARDELVAIAQDAGWIASADGKWTCNGCRSPIALAPAPTIDENRLRGVTVLIAEDHSDSREVLRRYLDEFGATCVESSSGSEAFDAFDRSRPDILLADLWMPEVDGLELIRRIRDLPSEHGRLTPAIAVSAQANEEQALMAGYHAVIRKPYDPALVVEMVEEFVRAESGAPSREASWTVVSHRPGTVEMTFVGQVGAPEAKAAIEVLRGYLETEPRRVVVDLRRVTGFSAAAGSAAQRAVWAKRFAIRHVHIIGGPVSVRVVASATCRLLGLGCTVERGGAVTDWPPPASSRPTR